LHGELKCNAHAEATEDPGQPGQRGQPGLPGHRQHITNMSWLRLAVIAPTRLTWAPVATATPHWEKMVAL